MGEPLKVPKAGSTHLGKTEVEDQPKGDVGLGDVDRLAILICSGEFTGKVQVYIAIHLPLRLLYGHRAAQGTFRISAGPAWGGDREPVVEDRAGGNDWPRGLRESNGYRGKKEDDTFERLSRCVIF